MPRYTYTCTKHGDFEIILGMREVTQTYECPECGQQAARNFQVDLTGVPAIWYTDGAHNTDYGRYGHKQDRIAKQYEQETGEKAPEPAKRPKNYKLDHDPHRHEERESE